jgi:Transglycosylase SLT domain
MNKVNLILLIIAMFTGFPAIVAVSQNITVATPSEAYFSQSSFSVVQNISSSSILPSSSINSNSLISSSSNSEMISSSVVIVSSVEAKPKEVTVEAPKIIEVKPISSAAKVMQDIKKPELVKEIAKPVIRQEVKTESKVATVIEEQKVVAKLIEVKPIIISSSSQKESLSANTTLPKTNLSYSEQIIARCEVLGCNSSQMIRIMKCESSGNPSAVGGGTYIGLFQFLPSTFNAYKVRAGLPNGDIYSGSDQIHVATFMFANGQASQWGCK